MKIVINRYNCQNPNINSLIFGSTKYSDYIPLWAIIDFLNVNFPIVNHYPREIFGIKDHKLPDNLRNYIRCSQTWSNTEGEVNKTYFEGKKGHIQSKLSIKEFDWFLSVFSYNEHLRFNGRRNSYNWRQNGNQFYLNSNVLFNNGYFGEVNSKNEINHLYCVVTHKDNLEGIILQYLLGQEIDDNIFEQWINYDLLNGKAKRQIVNFYKKNVLSDSRFKNIPIVEKDYFDELFFRFHKPNFKSISKRQEYLNNISTQFLNLERNGQNQLPEKEFPIITEQQISGERINKYLYLVD